MDYPFDFTISTGMGELKGLQQPGHQDFLGIRYALAPVGELRFQPPRRIDRWEGVYDAAHYGPMAPQAYPDTPPVQLEESEDCLVLNVYTPAADRSARPVMVYIHGGGFLIDSGSRPRTYGGPLAEVGNVVVVTIEYRMGAFGFLYMDGISPNLGLQDQVCALEWIRRHIAHFGGAPSNVTIFGESAGATSVAYLMVMPAAKGLFHRAILESGAFPLESQDENRRLAEAGTRKFVKQLGITAGDLAALQQAPYDEIMRAQKKVSGYLLFSDRAFYPVIDGAVVPGAVHDALRAGCAGDIPVIVGVNAEELPIFGAFLKPGLTRMLVKNRMLKTIKNQGATRRQIHTLLRLYRGALSRAERAARREYNHLFSDGVFRVPAILFAEAQGAANPNVFFYCFAHPAPKLQAAPHVMELYFVFGTLQTVDIAEAMRVPGTDEELRLAQDMMTAWATFARTGNPSHPGLPDWPRYDLERRSTMFFELQPRVVELPFDEIRSVWMGIVR